MRFRDSVSYLLVSRAVGTHRTAKSTLIFVNRSTMAIYVPLMRHQLLANVALELAVLRFQVVGHLAGRREKVIANRARKNCRRIGIVGIANLASHVSSRVLHAIDVIFGLHQKGRIIVLDLIIIALSIGIDSFGQVHVGHRDRLGRLVSAVDDPR